MNPKISVIVPVYNVGEYVGKCIQSVLTQSLKDIELILVNDGSSDNSLDILKTYALTDNRIKIINQSNTGVCYARKAGMEIAIGEYIHYLDADDYIDANCYETLYKDAAKKNADIVLMGFIVENTTKNKFEKLESYNKKEYTNIEFLKTIYAKGGYYSICQMIHKRELYAYGIQYQKGLTIGEDAYLLTQLVYNSKIIVNSSEYFYHYVNRNDSAINSKISDKKATDIILYSELIYDYFKDKNEFEELKIYLETIKIQSLSILFLNRYFIDVHKRSRQAMDTIKKHPEIWNMKAIRPTRKLMRLYAINSFLGNLYARYYIIKGKI